MVKILVSIVLALGLLVSAPFAASAADSGKIDGTLVNGTSTSTASMANLPIVLQIFQGTTKTDEKSTTTDQKGGFSFDGLSTASTNIYVVKVNFQNVAYYGEQLTFAAGETAKTTQVTVYETTTDDSLVIVNMSHIVVSVVGDVITIKENYLFLIGSDQTYIGVPSTTKPGERQSLKFSLPPGASSVVGSVGLANTTITPVSNEFYDSSVVTPDGTFISYNYKLDSTEDLKTISWKINYDTGRFDLLIENPNVKATGGKITPEEPLTISGKTYSDYSSTDLKKGDVLTVQFSNLLTPNATPSTLATNAPASQSNGSGSLIWAWLVLIPIAGVVIFLVIRAQKKSPHKLSVAVEPGNQDKEGLLKEIAELDDSYEEGNISQEEYLKLREEKKQQLIKLSNN